MEKIEWNKVCTTKITTFEAEYFSNNCKFVITSHYNNDKKMYTFKGFLSRNIDDFMLRYEVEPFLALETLEECKNIAENLIKLEEFYNESR